MMHLGTLSARLICLCWCASCFAFYAPPSLPCLQGRDATKSSINTCHKAPQGPSILRGRQRRHGIAGSSWLSFLGLCGLWLAKNVSRAIFHKLFSLFFLDRETRLLQPEGQIWTQRLEDGRHKRTDARRGSSLGLNMNVSRALWMTLMLLCVCVCVCVCVCNVFAARFAICPSLTMTMLNASQGNFERIVEKLETSLDSAIKQVRGILMCWWNQQNAKMRNTCVSENDNRFLQEDFKDAVALRNELSKLHIDESSAVLKANADFYRAFRCCYAPLICWHAHTSVLRIYACHHHSLLTRSSFLFSQKDISLMKDMWLNNPQVQVNQLGHSLIYACMGGLVRNTHNCVREQAWLLHGSAYILGPNHLLATKTLSTCGQTCLLPKNGSSRAQKSGQISSKFLSEELPPTSCVMKR